MKVVFLSGCFIAFLFVGEVCSFRLFSEEDLYPDVIDSDDFYTEEPSEDYPRVFVTLHENTEENQVETDEKESTPDVVTPSEEGEQPENTDFGPLPDFDELAQQCLVEKVEKLLSDFKTQQDKIAELEETNTRLVSKIDSIEQQVKTNSVILTNVNQDMNETFRTTLQKVLHVFNKIMKVRVSAGDIAVALRAETNLSTHNKPIIIKFTNFATKMKVLSASKRLSRTNISISSDYSELVAQKRAALLPYLQQVRARGIRAYILYDKLVMDGVKMTLEELAAQDRHNRDREQQEQVEEFA